MTDTIFSHRPIDGVSIGVRNVNGHLYIAVAIVNDGTSYNGIMNKDRRDSFCRATARSIIRGRIDACIGSCTDVKYSRMNIVYYGTKFAYGIDEDINPRHFIAEFRKTFKPTVDELDGFTCQEVDFPAGTVRVRMEANEISNKMRRLADAVGNQLLEEAQTPSTDA